MRAARLFPSREGYYRFPTDEPRKTPTARLVEALAAAPDRASDRFFHADLSDTGPEGEYLISSEALEVERQRIMLGVLLSEKPMRWGLERVRAIEREQGVRHAR